MEDIIVKLVGELDHSRFITGLTGIPKNIKYGDYLLSGLTTTGQQFVGYVVQIREKWGAFGSDMYFIRDHKGDLAVHENQGFWKLTAKQIEAIRPHFNYTPEEELQNNPGHTYTIRDKHSESGFIVSKENAPDRFDSCAFTVTVEDDATCGTKKTIRFLP